MAGVPVGLCGCLIEQVEADDGVMSVDKRDAEDDEQETESASTPAKANPVSRRVGASGVKTKRKKRQKLTVDDPPY